MAALRILLAAIGGLALFIRWINLIIVQLPLTKKMAPAMLTGLLLFLLGMPVRAADPIPCPMRMRYFTLLQGPHGKVAVGTRLYLGVYPKGTDTQFVAKQLQPFPPKKRYQYPEWLVARELQLSRQGDLNKILKLYGPGPTQKWARSLYSPMADRLKAAREVTAEALLFKAGFGPVLSIYTETKTPQYKFQFPWLYGLERSKNGGWLFTGSSGEKLFGILLNVCPYWLPANKRGAFKPTKNYLSIVRRFSKKYPKPDAAVYIRKITAFDPVILQAVRHIVHVYQTGSDKDVLAMWRPKDRNRIAKCLAHPNEYTNLRENYRDSSGHNISFRAYPSIIGKDVSLILLQRVGGRDIVVVRLAKIAGKWYQSRESDERTLVDWLPKYPAYEAYVLGHPKLAVLIRSRGH